MTALVIVGRSHRQEVVWQKVAQKKVEVLVLLLGKFHQLAHLEWLDKELHKAWGKEKVWTSHYKEKKSKCNQEQRMRVSTSKNSSKTGF